jgi:BASS family bile acid:Na+ symporter
VVALLESLGRRAAPVLAASLFLGIALQDVAALLRPLVGPAVIALMVCNLLRIDIVSVLRVAQRPGLILMLLAWLLLGVPLLAAALLGLTDLPRPLIEAILLTASSPVLTVVPTFALMMGLEAPLALFAVLATTVLQPIAQPPIVYWLLDIDLHLPMEALMLRLALFIGGGIAIAAILRRLCGAARLKRLDPAIGGVTVIVLVVFGIGLMDGVRTMIVAQPRVVLLYLIAGTTVNFLLQIAGIVAFRWMTGNAGLTFALTGACRNLATLVAVLGTSASAELALFLAIGQFPLYFIPALFGPIYRRLRRTDGD